MKIFAITLALAAAAAYYGFRPAKVTPAAMDPSALHEGKLAMMVEPASVFQRALWRHPAPDDRILHAERREWTKDSTQGVSHWQWFLAVKPGAALKKWLHERNPFSVHPAGDTTAPVIDGAPEWFPRDFSDYEIQTGGTRGSLVFLTSRHDGTFYATSSGSGFTPGTPEPATSTPALPPGPQGRLPQTPPPILPKP
jgi:hypothetical protein